MRHAYEEFYLKSPNDSYYLRGRAYTVEDFRRVASETAGFDLSDFFQRHVYGVEPPPYDEALSYVGLRLVRSEEQRAQGAGAPAARTAYRIEKDDKAKPEVLALRDRQPLL